MILNSPTISGSLTVTGNIIASGSITLSGSVASASYAATASFVALAQSASNAVSAQTASFANAFTVASTLTAQTLVVQTITSSVDFVTGSTRFGSILGNTHVFSGSVTMNPGGLFVSSSGLVGINTTNPTEILQTNGSIRALGVGNADICQLITDSSNSTTYRAALATFGSTAVGTLLGITRATNSFLYKNGAALVIGTGASDPLIFSTNDTEKMRINSTGSVLIGTTSAGYNNPSLLVNSQSGVCIPFQTIADSSGRLIRFYNSDFNNSNTGTDIRMGFTAGSGNTSFSIQVYTAGETAAGNLLLQPSYGNVGIGTSSPGFPLEISGTAGNIASDPGNGTLLNIYGGTISSADNGIGIGFTRATSQLGYIKAARENASNEASYMVFATQTTVGAHPERLRITSTGAICANVTTPFYDGAGAINTKVTATSVFMLSGQHTNGSNPRGIFLDHSATTGDYAIYYKAAGSEKFYVNGNGVIYSTSTSITLISSDYNLKTDIRNYDKGLAEVLAMKPRYFKYKDNLDEEKIGFIAQEMEQALSGSMIDVPTGLDTGNFHKSYQIDWYPLLVKAIQELKTQNDALQSRIETLESK